jgi:hypothetical protein
MHPVQIRGETHSFSDTSTIDNINQSSVLQKDSDYKPTGSTDLFEQCQQLRIELCCSMTAQMDGEPFHLPALVVVNISHADQVLVAKN